MNCYLGEVCWNITVNVDYEKMRKDTCWGFLIVELKEKYEIIKLSLWL